MDQLKETLIKREEKIAFLETVLSSIPNHIYWADKNHVCLGCNMAQAKALGCTSIEEAIGKSMVDLFPEEYASIIIKNNEEVISQGIEKVIEEHVILPNGENAIYLSHKVPLRNNNGVIVGVMGNSVDITAYKDMEFAKFEQMAGFFSSFIGGNKTEYKSIEEYLIAIKEYYENLIAQMPGNVYWEDCNGKILGCNNNQASISGLTDRRQANGKTIFDFLPEEQALVHRNNNQMVLQKNEMQTFEEVSIAANGEQFIWTSQKIPLKNNQGKIIGMLGVSLDITDRKKAEEYRIKHEAAEKVVKFTNLVAGSIAHELRTPLAGINSYMDLLEMSLTSTKQTQQEKDEFLKQAVTKIKSTIKATTHVITDLLLKVRTFATGQVPLKSFEEISISTDIENLLDSFPFENNEQDLVKVSYNTRFKYLGDKVLTSHVLGNLLKNALHAIKEADKGEIVIELKKDGDFNQLVLRDTALGISEDFVNKIFDQFETKKTTHGGSGLGLAFCKMVMEYYGGSIACQSKEGEYTEFTLSFPKIQTQQMEH